MNGKKHCRTIALKVEFAEIARATDLVNQFAAANHVKSSINHKINAVMDDVLANIISYGYENPAGHEIKIEFKLGPKRLDIVVTDDGRAFDPLSVPRPDTTVDLDDIEIGGLGIELIRHLADKVSYRRRADENILTLSFGLE